MEDPSLRAFIETHPLDEALACVRSEVLNNLTTIHTALTVLDQVELEHDQQYAVQIAQRKVHAIVDFMNEAILDIVIPRLKKGEG